MTIATLPVMNERLGVLLRILSTLAFATMGACIKALGDAVPLEQVVLCRKGQFGDNSLRPAQQFAALAA